jgi:chromosome segregation ATPase
VNILIIISKLEEIISKNNNDIKSLQDEIKDIKENINQMTEKESEIKEEINNYLKQEKNLNEKIKCIEKLNNSMKESIKSSNSSSIKTISKYDNEILSLESALNLGKNLKEKKQKLIIIKLEIKPLINKNIYFLKFLGLGLGFYDNKFILNVNSLLNEYQVYIDNLKDINNCSINKHDNNMIIETSNSNLQSLKHKETMENYIFGSKLSE